MKRIFAAIALTFLAGCMVAAQEAKIISDCTIYFNVSVDNVNTDTKVESVAGATKVVYIQGSKSRSDLITPGFKQTTITDTKSDTTIVLREIGNTKYISYLNNSKRSAQNKKYEGIQFSNSNEKKTILGYECRKVVAKLPSGASYNVFYTPSIIPSNKMYEYQFKDLPGFVLEYEAEPVDGKNKVTYSATKITLEPVPSALFDLPKTGYRIL